MVTSDSAPAWVGGCRPVQALDTLAPGEWHVRSHEVLVTLFVPAEVVVVERI